MCVGLGSGLFLLLASKSVVGVLLGVGCSFAGVVSTGSRTGTILAVCEVVGFIWISLRGRSRRGFVVASAALAVLCCTMGLLVFAYGDELWVVRSIQRVPDTLRGTGDVDPSILYRLKMWEALWQFALGSGMFIFIGGGFGGSLWVVREYVGQMMATHNTVIALVFETGVVGVALWLGVCAGGVFECLRIRRAGLKFSDRILVTWASMGLIWMCVVIASSFSFQILTVLKLFWMLLGLLVGIAGAVQVEYAPRRMRWK